MYHLLYPACNSLTGAVPAEVCWVERSVTVPLRQATAPGAWAGERRETGDSAGGPGARPAESSQPGARRQEEGSGWPEGTPFSHFSCWWPVASNCWRVELCTFSKKKNADTNNLLRQHFYLYLIAIAIITKLLFVWTSIGSRHVFWVENKGWSLARNEMDFSDSH